jgi:hypothetical protein
LANKLEGTKTYDNIMAAFAGESQARNKYTYFAKVAKKEGYEQILVCVRIHAYFASLGADVGATTPRALYATLGVWESFQSFIGYYLPANLTSPFHNTARLQCRIWRIGTLLIIFLHSKQSSFYRSHVTYCIYTNRQTNCPPSAASVIIWWAHQDSNLGPIGYEPTALPLSYGPNGSPSRIRTCDPPVNSRLLYR